MKYLGSLESDGGLFNITQQSKVRNWFGINSETQPNDYDIVCDKVEDNNIILHYKNDFLIFICNSKKLVTYREEKKLIICEQYYKSKNWDYSSDVNFVIGSNIDFVNFEEDKIIIYDSLLDSTEILLKGKDGFNKSLDDLPFYDYLELNFIKGKYEIFEVSYELKDVISLKGILLNPV